MSTIITGAFGRVGTAVLDHMDKHHDFILYDRVESQHPNSVCGNIINYDKLAKSSRGCNAFIHLAAASQVESGWESVLHSNIIGLFNCFEATRINNIEKFIFASSNHVVGMYEEEHSPDIYDIDYDLKIDHIDPVRPDSYYGASKVFGEAIGRFYVENFEYPKQVYNLRLGSIRPPNSDHPYADAEAGVDEGRWEQGSQAYTEQVNRLKATWQSRRDVADLIESCLINESVTYDIFYGTSDNSRSWFDIDRARDILGYSPQDNGEEWTSPP